MKKSLTVHANKEIKTIHGRSGQLNRLLNRNHARVLMDMIREHADEIKELHDKKDKHYLIETGDLIVLCLELIKEARQSPDAVLSKCYPRFHKKLSLLIRDQELRGK